jgi:hypothetical protein
LSRPIGCRVWLDRPFNSILGCGNGAVGDPIRPEDGRRPARLASPKGLSPRTRLPLERVALGPPADRRIGHTAQRSLRRWCWIATSINLGPHNDHGHLSERRLRTFASCEGLQAAGQKPYKDLVSGVGVDVGADGIVRLKMNETVDCCPEHEMEGRDLFLGNAV